jgi:hypothetical protein
MEKRQCATQRKNKKYNKQSIKSLPKTKKTEKQSNGMNTQKFRGECKCHSNNPTSKFNGD